VKQGTKGIKRHKEKQKKEIQRERKRAKKLQNQTVTIKKLRETLVYEKVISKILMKLTPC
jgi:hypothetical protein